MHIRRLVRCRGLKTICVATIVRCPAKTCGTTADPSQAIQLRVRRTRVRKRMDLTATVDLTVTADHEATMARMATARMATAPMVIGKDMAITVTTGVAKNEIHPFHGNRVGITPTRFFVE